MASDNDFAAALDDAARQAHEVISRIHDDARVGLDTNYWVLRTELNGRARRVSYDSFDDDRSGWFAGMRESGLSPAQPQPRLPGFGSGYHAAPAGPGSGYYPAAGQAGHGTGYHAVPEQPTSGSGYHALPPQGPGSGYHPAPARQQGSGYYAPAGHGSGYYAPQHGQGSGYYPAPPVGHESGYRPRPY